jgi:phage terminase large subunit-like protein
MTTIRALKAPGSFHVIGRKHFSHVKQSILLQTWPQVLEKCFPGLVHRVDKQDWYIEFENGSQIWFAGFDDKERMDKILGKEFVTVYLNEISELSFSHFEMLNTRLAQKVFQNVGGVEKEMPLKMYLDCNPPLKSHWSYKLFFLGMNPETRRPLPEGQKADHASIQMNPMDNKDNISKKYIEVMRNASPRMRKRFFEGEYGEDNPNALFSDITFGTFRNVDGNLPDFSRVVVGVDPSGTDGEDNGDAVGIVCGAIGVDGKAYLLEDVTLNAKPESWGKVAVSLYERHLADVIVCEKNFGGDMCRFVIQAAKPGIHVKMVNASRGKVVRAEPFSALYDQGKVIHSGYFHDLEDEMLGFSTNGYIGERSPNRADAWFWVLTELFSGMVNKKEKVKLELTANKFGW